MFFSKWKKKEKADIGEGKLPEHIAIVMDGNGRWAQKRGLPRNLGHREGSNTLRKIVKACDRIGIKYLTVYAFSTENWNRPKGEVDCLMDLLLEYLKNAENEIGGRNIRIRVIGNVNRLSEEIKSEIARVMKSTEKNDGMTLVIALNYGGRDEIVAAVKRIAEDVKKGSLSLDAIDEQTVADHLYTFGIPDPDLMIRPSGEKRISNFLLWQSAYTELCYSNVLWPDFDEENLLEAIKEYQSRDRRYGGV